MTIPLRRFHAQLLGMAAQQVVPAMNALTGLSSTLLLLVNLLGLAWLGLDLKISDLLNPKDEGKSRGVQQTRLTAALPEQYHSLDSQVG